MAPPPPPLDPPLAKDDMQLSQLVVTPDCRPPTEANISLSSCMADTHLHRLKADLAGCCDRNGRRLVMIKRTIDT